LKALKLLDCLDDQFALLTSPHGRAE